MEKANLHLIYGEQIMTRKLYLGIAALVAVAAITAARAEEVDVADLEYYADQGDSEVQQVSTMNVSTRFASMEAELESLRAQVQEISFGGGGGKAACGKCGASGCNCFCNIGCGGAYAGVELAVLRPHFEEGSRKLPNGTRVDPRLGYQATPRFWLGYRNCEGLGVRARYWQLNGNVVAQNLANDTGFYALNMKALDMEATQLVCWGPLQANFAAGVRYARTRGLALDDNFTEGSVGTFEGWGPTMAAEFRRPVACGPFSLIGNARGSLLFGNARHVGFGGAGEGRFVDADTHQDTFAQILESQIGVEYRRGIFNGTLAVRALLEGQIWMNAVDVQIGNFGANRFDNNAGLFGATFGVEYWR